MTPWKRTYPQAKVMKLVETLDREYPQVNGITVARVQQLIDESSSFGDLADKLAHEYHRIGMRNAFLDIITRDLV